MFINFNIEDDSLIGLSERKMTNGVLWEKDIDLSLCPTRIEAIRNITLLKILDIYQDKINTLNLGFAPYEVESFVDQRAEWRAYKADISASTPVIDALALARGITREALIAKIEAKILAMFTIQGEQNALEDSVKAASTIEALKSIDIGDIV